MFRRISPHLQQPWKKIYRRVGVIFIILLICLLCYSVAYLNYNIRNNPHEPKIDGDFPNQVAWLFKADTHITSAPLVDGSRIFLRTEKSIIAIDGETGKMIWSSGTESTYHLSLQPEIVNGMILVAEKNSSLAAFSIDNGELIWRTGEFDQYPENFHISSYVVDEQNVYVARYNYKLTAYDLDDGELVWERPVPSRANLPLVVNDRAVYVAAHDLLRAYSLENGRLLWDWDFDDLVGSMIIDRGVLYISVHYANESIVAIDLDTLKEKWTIVPSKLGGSNDIGNLEMIGDTLYASSNKLFGISKEDGTVVWASDDLGFLERPVAYGSSIFIRNISTTLIMLDSYGHVQGTLVVQADSGKYDPGRDPVIFADLLIVPFGDNRVFAYWLK